MDQIFGERSNTGKNGKKKGEITYEREMLSCEWRNCSIKYTSMEAFMGHVSTHLPDVTADMTKVNELKITYSCLWSKCTFKTSREHNDFMRHLFLHSYHTKLKCAGFHTHRRKNYPECRQPSDCVNLLPDMDSDFACKWSSCDASPFVNIQVYFDHVKAHAEAKRPSKKKEEEKEKEKEKEKKKKKKKKIEKKVTPISCEWNGCQKIFPNVTKLCDHLKSHTNEKVIACATCGTFFSNTTRLQDHCTRQDKRAIYLCSSCPMAFSEKRIRREHERSHQEKKYICELCNMGCSAPSALDVHMKNRHSTERPHECELCDKTFKTPASLTRHFKTHEKSVYVCSEKACGFKTKSRKSYGRHLVGHGVLDPARYLCHLCKKKFTRGHELKKHYDRAHDLELPEQKRSMFKIQRNYTYKLAAPYRLL